MSYKWHDYWPVDGVSNLMMMEKISKIAVKIVQIWMSGALFVAMVVPILLALPLMWIGSLVDRRSAGH
jgi:hypothetical protein